MTDEEILKLAELSRLSLTPEEVSKLKGEITSILGYIDTIRRVPIPDSLKPSPHLDLENVMRADESPHEPGIYTEKLAAQFPRRDGDYLKVKKILG